MSVNYLEKKRTGGIGCLKTYHIADIVFTLWYDKEEFGLTAEYPVTPKHIWNPWLRGYGATRLERS